MPVLAGRRLHFRAVFGEKGEIVFGEPIFET